jgi:transcriptional regulator with XRE-family HTH domain
MAKNRDLTGAELVGKRIKEARQAKGLTLARLGAEVGFEPFTAATRILHYEKGRHLPKLEAAEQIAAQLGVPAAYLFCRDDTLANWIKAFDPSNLKHLAIAAKGKDTAK